jgi:hypothetical protein
MKEYETMIGESAVAIYDHNQNRQLVLASGVGFYARSSLKACGNRPRVRAVDHVASRIVKADYNASTGNTGTLTHIGWLQRLIRTGTMALA